MAVTYNNIVDGQSVTTWATNQNTFGNAVKNNIDIVEASIALLETEKITVGDTGLLYTVTGTSIQTYLNTTYQKVIMADVLQLDKSNGHLTINVSSGVITFVTAGVYNVHFAGAMTAANGIMVTFNYNLNGVSVLNSPPQFEGKGTTPVAIVNSMFMEATAGSTIYVEAKSSAGTTMTPLGCGISIEKTHY